MPVKWKHEAVPSVTEPASQCDEFPTPARDSKARTAEGGSRMSPL